MVIKSNIKIMGCWALKNESIKIYKIMRRNEKKNAYDCLIAVFS